ncbi:DUF2891 domain-containing protein, partial [Polaribacter sp.]|nr:DUF2891 domain-containing protein [Polaribacter sp.]
LLKLAEELHTWNDPIAKELEQNLQPLTDLMVQKYIEFLPRLKYPIRVGEHSNTAFGLAFAWDYANTVGDKKLLKIINNSAKDYFMNDKNCPISWEPSGFDFLSCEFCRWLEYYWKNSDYLFRFGSKQSLLCKSRRSNKI